MKQNFATTIYYFMYKMTAPLAIHNTPKSFMLNCGEYGLNPHSAVWHQAFWNTIHRLQDCDFICNIHVLPPIIIAKIYSNSWVIISGLSREIKEVIDAKYNI